MKHAFTIYLLGTGAALAHGGHDAAVLQGDAHWLTSGDHVLVLGLTVLAVALWVRPVLRRLRAALART